MIRIYGEIHSSKNSRQIHTNRKTGRQFVAKSKAAKADEEMFDEQLSLQILRWEEMAGTEDNRSYPLRVYFRFIRKTHARWDFANLVQGVADAMVKVGYIPDDDVEHFIPEYDGHSVDKENPGVVIRLASEKL